MVQSDTVKQETGFPARGRADEARRLGRNVHFQSLCGQLSVLIPFNPHPDVSAEITVINWLGPRTVTLPVSDQYALLLEAFSRAVRAGGPVPLPPRDAVKNLKVTDALFRSEKSGGWEKVG